MCIIEWGGIIVCLEIIMLEIIGIIFLGFEVKFSCLFLILRV